MRPPSLHEHLFYLTMLPSIHSLRRAGFKVKIDHYRNVQLPAIGQHVSTPTTSFPSLWRSVRVTRVAKKAREYNAIHPKGGRTELFIQSPEPDGKVGHAVATCNDKDRFDRKLAVKICLGRIAKAGMSFALPEGGAS